MRIVPLSDGDPSLPTLVCLPGAMCTPSVFSEAAHHSGVRAIALAWLEDDGAYDLPAIAARVQKAIADEARVVLVGHSLGTPLAVLAALLDIEAKWRRVRGLVLSNSGANTRGHGDAETIVQRIESDWGEALWDAFIVRCFQRLPALPLLDEVRLYPSQLRKERVAAAISSQLKTDLLPSLARLGGIPTAVVHGTSDPARTLTHAQELAGAIPDAALHVVDTGHTSCAEDPLLFGAIMRDVSIRSA